MFFWVGGMNAIITISTVPFCPRPQYWPDMLHKCFRLQEAPSLTETWQQWQSCVYVQNKSFSVEYDLSLSTCGGELQKLTCFHQGWTGCLRLYSTWQERCNFHLNPHGSLSAACFPHTLTYRLKETRKSGSVQEGTCPIPSTQRWSQCSTAIYSWLYVRMNKHY